MSLFLAEREREGGREREGEEGREGRGEREGEGGKQPIMLNQNLVSTVL